MAFQLLDFITWLEKYQLPCLFRQLTHIDCPGCGMQRSFLLLLGGDVAGSFRMYPALIPVLLLFGLLILHGIFKFRKGAVILQYSFIFCTAVILLGYFYKIVIARTVLVS